MRRVTATSLVRSAAFAAGLVLVVPGGAPRAADVAVAAKKLIVIDKTAVGAGAKIVYVSTDRSAGIAKGAGTDPATVGVDFDLGYATGSTAGAFVVPPGELIGTDGWVVNKPTVAKYVNKAAPAGPTGVKVAVIKPDKLLKLVARSLGDLPIDVVAAGAPTSGMETAYTVTNDGETTRHCTRFPMCTYKSIAGGTGVKLLCKDGLPGSCPGGTTTTTSTTVTSTTTSFTTSSTTTSTTASTTTSSTTTTTSSTTTTSTTTSTAASCSDGVQNQDETDIDCGGAVCPDCAGGAMCLGGADCESSICSGFVCWALVDHDYTTTSADWGTSDITLVGTTVWSADPDPLFAGARQLRLTTNGGGQQGAAWYDVAAIDASQDWTTTFRFQISYPTGGGADGMAFHVQPDGLGANPNENGVGLSTPYLTVSIDTWNNGPEGTDESLRVFLNGTQILFNDLLDFGPDPNPGSSSTVFRMDVTYSASDHMLHLFLDDEGGPDVLANSVGADLSGFGPSYFGFSGRTGGSTENHDVRTWRLKHAP